MGVTLKEIAALAGVHRSTVDKVLHKRPGVSDEVRRRVQAVIDETGYRPNPVGRALQKQSAVIRLAAILLEVDARPFMERGIRKAVDALHMYNIQVDYHACAYGDVETQLEQIECAIRGQVDGIILSPLSADSVREAVNRAVAAGIPVVCTNTDIEGTGRLCYVGEDAAKASRIAGRILGEFLGGAGEIAVITSTSAMRTGTYFLKVRETGFQGYMAENFPGIHIVESVPSLENPAMTYQMTLELLRRQPELRGVYVVGGGVREVGRAIRETGCGGRLKVVCFEDYPEIQELLRENIVTCTINSDTVRQGELPVRILIDYLMQDERPAENVYIPGQILVRECL
ncbi:MAG: LacI family DNA-binding transcriptional regulator [Butyricicoccus pullicaecorum]|nr:LacI family DNA-binding transcriptional regulator [Butyricicoccus pullicaecorum]